MSHFVRLKAWGYGLFIAIACGSMSAEEQPLRLLQPAQTMLLAYYVAAPIAADATLNLSSASALSSASSMTSSSLTSEEVRPTEQFQEAEERLLNLSLWTSIEPISSSEGSSLVLLTRRMPSRYSYSSWARLHTGYGQFFKGDTMGRFMTSGAGFEEPNWLYVKMSLKW